MDKQVAKFFYELGKIDRLAEIENRATNTLESRIEEYYFHFGNKKESKELDWQLLEEKFCKEWNKRILANNRMQYWEINQWYKDNV
jgi:hypothetical protein